jgi:hypothetical protein
MTPKSQLVKYMEAEERKLDHARRTPEEQLALLGERPGNSAGERERLRRKIAKAKDGKKA